MNKINNNIQCVSGYTEHRNPVQQNLHIKPTKLILPVIVIGFILIIVCAYTYIQRKDVVHDIEALTEQMSEHIANNIANEFYFAESSIKLSALDISLAMTSDNLENPAEVILPKVKNTPFQSMEYIRADGMNVMNIGEPFDASDRVYYIEGIKGNTGIWNNYNPKTSKETLVNFYTPLLYDGKIAGVITGYIAATSQLAPIFETTLYDERIYGILLDENNMVICSNIESEFVPNLTLEKFVDQFGVDEKQKQRIVENFKDASKPVYSYNSVDGKGRTCICRVPGTDYKVAVIVPAASFNAIIWKNTRNTVGTIVVISLILMGYSAYVLIRNIRRRKAISAENAKLEEANRIYNEVNRRAFSEISEIRDIIASANMGTWRIELVEGQEPRMYVDDTMQELLGITGLNRTPEKTYDDWFSRVKPSAVTSVLHSVEKMQQGFFDENTYLWIHPQKGERYVRCGGTARKIPGGFALRGYHYDVDEVVREDQAKVIMLQDTLNEKKEYYDTLATLGDIFYSMHVLDLAEDTVVEFTARGDVAKIVNHKNGAAQMMIQVMSAVTAEEYLDAALEFTDLTTLSERMRNRKLLSKQLVGKNTGWFIASFITMERDSLERPTKVIYTTRVIDEEKQREIHLIEKTQTDELTGLFNRRAYEEDIYEHNDIPEEDDFIYISLDVNGLKVVNDTKGHMAGDELIVGACQCMKHSLGDYGKLYRIGGDEFVAILFCKSEQLKAIIDDFDRTIQNWSGKLVESLSISYGWASREEMPDYSVRQLGALAEERMYEAKTAHYRKTGVDRRGQKDAHKALCELYTKIIKINITDDSYQVIDMDMDEQTKEKGFASKISDWFTSFGTTGHVHPDDLPEYLKLTNLQYMREYFASNKTSLHIFYRRKYSDGFKQVMMEIIPANDYSEDSQNLFLYVKDIDK